MPRYSQYNPVTTAYSDIEDVPPTSELLISVVGADGVRATYNITPAQIFAMFGIDPDNIVAGTIGLLDEDNMASNAADQAPSQQSTKAYVDNSIAALPETASIDEEHIMGRAVGEGTGVPTPLTKAEVLAILEVQGWEDAPEAVLEYVIGVADGELRQEAVIDITPGNSKTAGTDADGDLEYRTAAQEVAHLLTEIESALGVTSIPFTAASASTPAYLEFAEDTDNGSSVIALKAPTSISASVDVILPAAAGTLLTATDLGFTAASTSGSARFTLAEDTDNGAHKITIAAPASIAADVTVVMPGLAGTVLSTAEAATLTKGFNATEYDAGTKSSGTYTPDPADGNFQKAVNGGAFTLAPPASTCAITVQITNNASAGAVTTSGFTRVVGDPFTTTNGDDFMCQITRDNSFSVLNIVALQ